MLPDRPVLEKIYRETLEYGLSRESRAGPRTFVAGTDPRLLISGMTDRLKTLSPTPTLKFFLTTPFLIFSTQFLEGQLNPFCNDSDK